MLTNGLTQAEIDDVSSLLSAIGVSSRVTPNWCNGAASDDKPPSTASVKTALDRMRRLARLEPVVWDKLDEEVALPYLVTALEQAWNNKRKRLTGMCVCGAARAG